MKKVILIAVGVALVAGLAAGLQPAEAACGLGYVVNSVNSNGATRLFTPGNPFDVGNLDRANNYPNASFWSLGYGNTASAVPPNNDSGTNSGGTSFYAGTGGSSNWFEMGYYGAGSYLGDYYNSAHWQYPGTDGCIDFDGTNGNHSNAGAFDTAQCNVVLVDDDDDAGTGYFLLASQSPSAGGDYFMNLALTGGAGTVNLSPIPVPQITGSSSVSALVKNLTVVVPCPVGPAQGVYANCLPGDNTLLNNGIGVQLYSTTTGVNLPPGGARSRDLPSVVAVSDGGNPSGWAPLAGGAGACGAPLAVTVSCVSDSSIWLCASLVADGDFETGNCSGNAVRVDCGPTLANPDEPVIKRDKPSIDRRENRDRGSRDGR